MDLPIAVQLSGMQLLINRDGTPLKYHGCAQQMLAYIGQQIRPINDNCNALVMR